MSRVIVVGLGVQGRKRRAHAEGDFVAAVDPIEPEAQHRSIGEIPSDGYDAALVCTPDRPKMELLRHLLARGKHILVEKPLHADTDEELAELERLARVGGVVCRTAYNHRFEPHFEAMRDLIASGELGRIYSCRMFYGNGTARLVRDSAWRDQGAGVLPDLGSHLLDTCRFWFGDLADDFRLIAVNRFENRAPDHVTIGRRSGDGPAIELEMTLCMWRNHFTCDILAEKGSAHIESLCKWGPASFTHRIRTLPSGRPVETRTTLTQEDPTWALEYRHFKELIRESRPADLANDRWLRRCLSRLGDEAMEWIAGREP